ncbi:MAG: hypothetical protein GY748_23315 [Planctomycetaceae bacterium]|nr:hypothetical protein [Planctomycetaceae bacterium]
MMILLKFINENGPVDTRECNMHESELADFPWSLTNDATLYRLSVLRSDSLIEVFDKKFYKKAYVNRFSITEAGTKFLEHHE